MSMLGDKDISTMLAELAPHLDGLVATGSHHVRALPAAVIAEAARAYGLEARVEERPEASLAAAREWAGRDGVVIVAGSLYLLGDIREVALRCNARFSARRHAGSGRTEPNRAPCYTRARPPGAA